jgi:hypothetical protein
VAAFVLDGRADPAFVITPPGRPMAGESAGKRRGE